MSEFDTTDHELNRSNDSDKILNSSHPRKVVLAGPGTGKSYLFEEAIRRKKEKGGQSFLALTFIGKLSDELADNLAGLAHTTTLHGFARGIVLDNSTSEWEYYPRMFELIKEDLAIKGITDFEVGDTNYEERTNYYKAIGDNDVVHYAVQICKNDETKIPVYDLILVDEFQDFNETEAQLIDLLTKKNEVLIVGDDDQALYEFKGSFSKFIREKFSEESEFESHTLKYCSRCTEIIIKAFHNIIENFRKKGKLVDRIEKEYRFYPPGKQVDCELNPKLLLLKQIPPGMIPYKIRFELKKLLEEQKIKSVLILGEGRACKPLLLSIAKKLKEYGFKKVTHAGFHNKQFVLKSCVASGYKILSNGLNDILGWRLLIDNLENPTQKEELITNYYNDSSGFISAIPDEFKKAVGKNSRTLQRILDNPESDRNSIGSSSIQNLEKSILEEEKERRKVFMDQIIDENKHLPRPLANLSITVCSILGAKGLSADVVFLVGFDQGKLPNKVDVEDSEIYQLLVALTRARKRMYFINTVGIGISQFIENIDEEYIQEIS